MQEILVRRSVFSASSLKLRFFGHYISLFHCRKLVSKQWCFADRFKVGLQPFHLLFLEVTQGVEQRSSVLSCDCNTPTKTPTSQMQRKQNPFPVYSEMFEDYCLTFFSLLFSQSRSKTTMNFIEDKFGQEYKRLKTTYCRNSHSRFESWLVSYFFAFQVFQCCSGSVEFLGSGCCLEIRHPTQTNFSLKPK